MDMIDYGIRNGSFAEREWHNKCKAALQWLVEHEFLKAGAANADETRQAEQYEAPFSYFPRLAGDDLLSPVRNRGGNIEPNWERFYDSVATLGAKKNAMPSRAGSSLLPLCSQATCFRSTVKVA